MRRSRDSDLTGSNQLPKYLYLSLPSQVLGIIRIGQGKDWLAQRQDNEAEWDIRSWCWWPDLAIGQHY